MSAVEQWSEAVEAFAEHLRVQGRQAQPTRWQYVQHVRWLAESMSVGPWLLTSAQLLGWLEVRGWSRETRRKVLVSLRAFYAWAVAHGRLDWAPTAGLPSAESRRRGPAPAALPPAWRGPAYDFTAWLQASAKSPGTVGQYGYRLKLLSEVAADPWAVTTMQLAAWVSNPDWSPQTKRSSIVAVRAFYRWAVLAGHVEVNPTDGLDMVRVPRRAPRPAPESALRAALAGGDDRLRLILALAAYAGLRSAEIAGLHWSQVADTHLMVEGKGSKVRMVPLDPEGELARMLAAEAGRRRLGRPGSGFPVTATDSGWVFPSDRTGHHLTAHHVTRLGSRALPEVWTNHTLRHRFATNAYAAERDLQAVQQLLGHARPETTAVYAQVPDGALLAAVRAAGGRRVTAGAS